MNAPAVVDVPQVGEVVELRKRDVVCSRCDEPTDSPVFMGVSSDGARLPLWWCPGCKQRFEATS